MIKKILKKTVPQSIILFIRRLKLRPIIKRELKYERYMALHHSSQIVSNQSSALANLMVISHVLEKGITMPERRLGFGLDRVRDIIRCCNDCIKNYSANHIEVQSTLKDLEQYLSLHEKENYNLPKDIIDNILSLLKYKQTNTVPCFEISKDEYFKSTRDFREFAYQRRTVRWYSDEAIDHDRIIKAVELAKTAPSACNRQSTKVYIIENRKKKKQILSLQNGNRGFGDKADKILLLTTNMNYWGCKDLKDAYLDVGIFTQNLLYALHYYHIVACTLNANMNCDAKESLREIVGFTKAEIPVVFISIGNAPEYFQIAGSQRINTNQIYSFV